MPPRLETEQQRLDRWMREGEEYLANGYQLRRPEPEPKRRGPRIEVRALGDGVMEFSLARTGPRMIYGCATTPAIGANQQSLSSDGAAIRRMPIPLKFGHDAGQIGEVVWIRRSPQAVMIRAIVASTPAGDHTWRLIKSGEVRSLSVGPAKDGHQIDAVVDGVRYFRVWTLAEVSLARRAANLDAFCRVYRDD